MAEKKEEHRQSPHVKPEADGSPGLYRVGRREQKEEKQQEKRGIRPGCFPGCDAETDDQEGDDRDDERGIEIELGNETPQEFTELGGRRPVEERRNEIAGIGEKADVGLVLEIREVVNEPTDGEEDDWYQASPFEVTFLGGADFHAGSVLTVGPDQGGPVLEYIVFFPESVCFFHGKLF